VDVTYLYTPTGSLVYQRLQLLYILLIFKIGLFCENSTALNELYGNLVAQFDSTRKRQQQSKKKNSYFSGRHFGDVIVKTQGRQMACKGGKIL
jgi:hypothetical protein